MSSVLFSKTSAGLTWFGFSGKEFSNTCHGFFTRNGGVSPVPWKSLNLSESTGDSRVNVIENRKLVFDAIQRPVESVFDVWQVHSTRIVCTEEPRDLSSPHQKADGILTNNPKVTLLMRFADCVPILLYDPVRRVVGLVHAGWQGTVANIAGKAISTMVDTYHSNPENIVAGIGPSIGPDHYQVGEDVHSKAKPFIGNIMDQVFRKVDGELFFDLWEANSYLLKIAGVSTILRSGLCTACDIDNWYSHRHENSKTGRFAAVIALDS